MDPEASAASDNRRDDVIENLGNLGDHGAERAVPDAFLEARGHGFLIAGIDVDDAVRGETDLGKRGRKEILAPNAPEDFALSSSPRCRRRKRAAAAPSMAALPPPATSCSAPSVRPPPGRRLSIASIPNGSTERARGANPDTARPKHPKSPLPPRRSVINGPGLSTRAFLVSLPWPSEALRRQPRVIGELDVSRSQARQPAHVSGGDYRRG